jgi:hypothetical protein
MISTVMHWPSLPERIDAVFSRGFAPIEQNEETHRRRSAVSSGSAASKSQQKEKRDRAAESRLTSYKHGAVET